MTSTRQSIAGRVFRLARSKGPLFILRIAVYRATEWCWERRYGLATDADEPSLADTDVNHGYCPTPYSVLRWIFKNLEIQAGRDVFLDFGAGKGRVVSFAARYPFARVIGVEMSPELCEIARENIRLAPGTLQCRDVSFVTTDARAFVIPEDVSVIYFYNPFHGEVLDSVVSNIKASLRARPRRLTVVYFNNGRFEETIAQDDWFTRTRERYFFVMPCMISLHDCRPPD